MSSDVVYTAVRNFLEESWTATPLAWENEPFTTPEPPAPFVFIELFADIYEQVSIGSGSPAAERWREEGAVLAHITVPAGTGSLAARQHATTLTNLLRGLELPGDVRFRGMSIGVGSPSEDGQFYVLTVRAEWVRG